MTQEQFQQAAELYKAGDKQGSEKILLEIARLEPDNADAWYGLALCSGTEAERKARLEKCLAISPQHARALKALSKLQEGPQAQLDANPAPAPAVNNIDTKQVATKEAPRMEPRPGRAKISIHWIYSPVILILIGLVIWQFVRLDRLEKMMVTTNNTISNHEISITGLNDDISNHEASIMGLINDVSSIYANENIMSGNIRSLAAGLDYVTPLAENANRYAHSHTTFYSDARLKTGVTEINNSLDKVLQLRGVYFHWDVSGYPQLGLSDQPQIGVIAQEVESVFPELVTTNANGYKQVDYEKLTAVLIETTKEQQKEITALNDRLTQIEGK